MYIVPSIDVIDDVQVEFWRESYDETLYLVNIMHQIISAYK